MVVRVRIPTPTALQRQFWDLVGRATCVFLGGHLDHLVFEPERLSMRCAVCGRPRPGWAIERKVLVFKQPEGV